MHPVEALIPGAQGRVLAVLSETTAELNLRTVARLADVSPAQASRVLPALVELGLVERREVPPSSLFRLNHDNLAARFVLELARSRQTAVELIGVAAGDLPLPPVSVIIFGSFARREAGRNSDIDILVVRPDDVVEDDPTWVAGVDRFREQVRATTGNRVEIVEATRAEAREKLSGAGQLWRDIAVEGVVVLGATLDELRGGPLG